MCLSVATGVSVNSVEVPEHSDSPAVDEPLSDRDIELVQTTFAKVAEVGPEAAGRILFGHIFRIAPGAKALFSFAYDDAAMERHGAKVVNTVGTAVSLLNDLETLVPVLQRLGLQHVGYGTLPAHYDVVGQAFIATLEDALQSEFTEPVRSAYVKVWNIVQATMTADNYA
jgi:hemoglobin-like flavoprotein